MLNRVPRRPINFGCIVDIFFNKRFSYNFRSLVSLIESIKSVMMC